MKSKPTDDAKPEPNDSSYSLIEQVEALKQANKELLEEHSAAFKLMEEAILSKDALRLSEDKYRTLFNSIDEAFCIFELVYDDADQPVDILYLEVNPAFDRLTGMGNPIGKRVSTEFPQPEANWYEIYDKVVRTGEPLRFEQYYQGTGHWYRLYASRMGGEDSHVISVIFDDITSTKRHEQELLFLSDLSKELVASIHVEETVKELTEKIGLYFNVSWCIFAQIDQTKTVEAYGWHQEDLPSLQGRYQLRDFLIEAQLSEDDTKLQIIVNDTQADPRVNAANYKALGIHSFIITPLIQNKEWHFLLSIIDTKVREWRQDEIALMQEITQRIWARLERARAEEALRQSEERMRGVKEAFQSAIHGEALNDSLNILARLATHEIGGGVRTAFYLTYPDGLHLYPILGAGNMPETYTKEIDGFVVGENSFGCGLAVAAGRPVFSQDIFADPGWHAHNHLAKNHNFRSCGSFPIHTHEGKSVGTFALYFTEAHEVTPQEHALADVITQAAAIIISRHTEAQERLRAETALLESEEKLRRFNASLEQEVAERTKELKENREDLFAKNEELNHSIAQLESFNYIASHDLREPLRKIQTFVNLANEKKHDEKKLNTYLNSITESAGRMTQLINDLLDYSRLAHPDEAFQEVNLNEIMENIMVDFEIIIGEKQASIECDPLPVIKAIPFQMHQLFANLISNGLKFNEGKPQLKIAARTVEGTTLKAFKGFTPKGNYVELTFADNGIGFDEEYREKIFDVFQRLHSKSEYSGTGIGLSIVGKIVQNHNGFIVADGGKGQGATFRVWLPEGGMV